MVVETTGVVVVIVVVLLLVLELVHSAHEDSELELELELELVVAGATGVTEVVEDHSAQVSELEDTGVVVVVVLDVVLDVVLELQSFQTGLEVVKYDVVVIGLSVVLEETQFDQTALGLVVVVVVVVEEDQSDQTGAAPLCCSAQWVTTSPMTVEMSLGAQAATTHC